MKLNVKTWPKRFVRWLCRTPFEQLPPQYGSTVPPELQRFEAQAEEVTRRGLGQVAAPAVGREVKVKPARQDQALERQ